MNKLPCEIICHISEFLTGRDLANFSKVFKNNQLIISKALRTQPVFHIQDYDIFFFIKINYKPSIHNDISNLFTLEQLVELQETMFESIFKYVKYFISDNSSFIEKNSRLLHSLEKLELTLPTAQGGKILKIKLPNLKEFVLNSDYTDDGLYITYISCPKLKKLVSEDIDGTYLSHPLELENLECAFFKNLIYTFTSLKTLKLGSLKNMDKDFFKKLNNLEEVHIENCNQMQLYKFLRLRNEVETNVKIIFKNIEVEDPWFIEKNFLFPLKPFTVQNISEFNLNEDKVLQFLPSLKEFQIDSELNEKTKEAFSVINNLKYLEIKEAKPKDLMYILKLNPDIMGLTILNDIHPRCYETIGNNCKTLFCLTLFILPKKLDFLYKLKNLIHLYCATSMSIRKVLFISKLVSQLNLINFKYKNSELQIQFGFDEETRRKQNVVITYKGKVLVIEKFENFKTFCQDKKNWSDVIKHLN